MNIKHFWLPIFSLIMILACNDNNDFEDIDDYDCEFEQDDSRMDGLIDDTERSIMETCMDDAHLDIDKIKENLIGNWVLIGHGEGWLPFISQPCAHISISENELILEFENAYIDTTTFHTWDIEVIDWSGGTYYSLEVTPNDMTGLYINQFCDNYMFGDGTPFDGNMYLYEKQD